MPHLAVIHSLGLLLLWPGHLAMIHAARRHLMAPWFHLLDPCPPSAFGGNRGHLDCVHRHGAGPIAAMTISSAAWGTPAECTQRHGQRYEGRA